MREFQKETIKSNNDWMNVYMLLQEDGQRLPEGCQDTGRSHGAGDHCE